MSYGTKRLSPKVYFTSKHQARLNVKYKWLVLNGIGLFPGKEESEEAFLKRAAFCQNLNSFLREKEELKDIFPFTVFPESRSILEESFSCSSALYGIKPGWIPLIFDNTRLLPWHAGCAWIFQLDATSPTATLLQCRKNFLKQQTYLYLYKRSELIAHELAHAGRMMYEEPKYEEFFAYQSSASFLRRLFGPIFESSKETLLFIISLFIVLVADLAAAVSGLSWQIATLPKIFVLFLVLAGCLRLFWRQAIYRLCLKVSTLILKDRAKAAHFVYRLTDSEILLFSRSSKQKVVDYIEKQASTNFRWKFLKEIYIDS